MLIENKLAIQRQNPKYFWQGEVSTLLLLKIIGGDKDFSGL